MQVARAADSNPQNYVSEGRQIMNLTTQHSKKTGDCDCCTESLDVTLYAIAGGMFACESCRDKQNQAQSVLNNSHSIDSAVQSKGDVFNAPTVSNIELKGAIENNPAIPAEQKEFEYAREVNARFIHAQEVLFSKRQAVQEAEKVVKEYQKDLQIAVGKLPTHMRTQFKSADVTYSPIPATKTPKPGKSNKPVSETAAKRREISEAAEKTGVDSYLIRMTLLSHKEMTAVQAAEYFLSNSKKLQQN